MTTESQLKEKLEITLDPTVQNDIHMDKPHSDMLEFKLKEFDEAFNSLDSLRGNPIQSIMTYRMKYDAWEDFDDSIKKSNWFSKGPTNSEASNWGLNGLALCNEIIKVLKSSLWQGVQDSLDDDSWEGIEDIIYESIWLSRYATVHVNLNKKEYESMFNDKHALEELPYDELTNICNVLNWFTKRGLFIVRSMTKGEYIIASWHNKKVIHKINIYTE